jgi:aryl-alcohol dehydrogenase-like predicted oxidoreductase
MDFNILGKTGVTVSALGVGTGGPSRVGLRTGGDDRSAADAIRYALDLGVNFLDTAEAYGTERVVRQAISGVRRQEVVLSTKISHWEELDQATVEEKLDERLTELGTDYIDICHFHAVRAEKYPWLAQELYPGLERAREKGKVRWLGITEAFIPDPGHQTLSLALDDGFWDVMMVGYNLLNQSAERRVFPQAEEQGTGILAMFAVRLALSRAERLTEVVGDLIERGEIDADELESLGGSKDDPLGWFVRESGASSLQDAAYRFVRHHPAVHVTLSGTGNTRHLEQNSESVQKPPLEPEAVNSLRRLFRNVDSVSGH